MRRYVQGEKKASFEDSADQAFKTIYLEYKKFLPKEYSTKEENPFFMDFENLGSIGKIGPSEGNKSSDLVFREYLKSIEPKCNSTFFLFAVKFVTLFRECINKCKGSSGEKQYTEDHNAESVPDLCNEFVTEFLESADYFGLNSEEMKSEIIEIIQHFCYWLFSNNYTTSRLTLLS